MQRRASSCLRGKKNFAVKYCTKYLVASSVKILPQTQKRQEQLEKTPFALLRVFVPSWQKKLCSKILYEIFSGFLGKK